MRADLGRDGVACLAPPSPRPTSLALVSLADGQPRYEFYRENTAERDVTAAGLLAALPAAADTVYVGSLALTGRRDGAAWAEVFETLAKRRFFTAIDPNVRANFIEDEASYRTRLTHLFGHARLIKLSDEDIAWIAPGAAPETAAEAVFRASGAELLVLTLGGEGARGFTAGGTVSVPAHPVEALKTQSGPATHLWARCLPRPAIVA